MSPEAQRIAIAEACKTATKIVSTQINADFIFPIYYVLYDTVGRVVSSNTINYLSDLNAMHEAEKVLLQKSDGVSKPDFWDQYIQHLGGDWPSSMVAHATAAQRAEAFLRTLNLWGDMK